MIRVDFDPARIADSLLLSVVDIKDPAGLAERLRVAGEPLFQYLREEFSAGTRQQLDEYTGANPVPESLRGALVDDLNQLISGSTLFDKKRCKGIAWTRETLLRALIKLDPKGEDVACFNRLLLEEIFSREIAKSRKAEWNGWTILAHAATEKVIEEWEDWKQKRSEWKKNRIGPSPEFEPVLDDDIWKGFRDWLLVNAFKNKCAYCETVITGFPGDSEHFRPKGRVRVILDDGRAEIVKIVDEDGEEIPHPGYFWLAYHWQNILPSCEFCNRFGGKKDLFPVERSHVGVRRLTIEEIDKLIYKMTQSTKRNGIFYLEPGDLDVLEGPLLLHPYDKAGRPEDHLYFKADGQAAAWCGSKRGEASKKIYDLNEPSKVNARRAEQWDGFSRFCLMLAAIRFDDGDFSESKRVAKELEDDYYRGRRPYAVAVFDFIHERFEGSPMDPDKLLGNRRKSR